MLCQSKCYQPVLSLAVISFWKVWRCSSKEQDGDHARTEGIPEGTGEKLPPIHRPADTTHQEEKDGGHWDHQAKRKEDVHEPRRRHHRKQRGTVRHTVVYLCFWVADYTWWERWNSCEGCSFPFFDMNLLQPPQRNFWNGLTVKMNKRRLCAKKILLICQRRKMETWISRPTFVCCNCVFAPFVAK